MVDSNLSKIPGDNVKTALKEVVERKLKTNDFELNLDYGSKKGDNFIGIVYRISFNKLDDAQIIENGTDTGFIEKKEKKTGSLILKVAPQNFARRERFFSRPCFLREIYLYEEVLPYLRKFQESKGVIVEENGFYENPKCYKTIDTEPTECLILQDLKEDNFEMINHRTEAITAAHVKLVMQALGKFHAISFALKDQQPDKFKAITSELSEIFIRKGDPMMSGFINSLSKTVIDSITDAKDHHLLENLNKLFTMKSIDILAECVNGELAEPYAVICHGDCWTNNTMFKYDQKNNPNEVSLLDWQISRYASPVCDILYYIFCCTTKGLRDKHYDDFLKVYHDSLSSLLKSLGSDPEKLFPFEAMQEQLRKFGKLGLAMGSMLIPMLTSEDANSRDLDELAEEIQSGKKLDEHIFISDKSRDGCNKRLRDVVADMSRLGYI